MSNPGISVLVLVYRHEPWLRQCLDSIMAQECARTFEVLIGEDCSPDASRSICQAYADKYPEQVRLFVADSNLGMHKNFLRLWHAARGDYIALLEGDDYWTDPGKLSKQADFMDRHRECTCCGARTANMRFRLGEVREQYDLVDVLTEYPFHTSSAMFRRGIVTEFPPAIMDVKALDSCLYVLHAQRGPCGFVNETLSFYRRHGGGVWSGMVAREQHREITRFTDAMASYVGSNNRAHLLRRELTLCRELTNGILAGKGGMSFAEAGRLAAAGWPRLARRFPLRATSWALETITVAWRRRARQVRAGVGGALKRMMGRRR